MGPRGIGDATSALEKLVEQHGFEVSITTLRQWMIDDGLWTPRKLRDCVHQLRFPAPA